MVLGRWAALGPRERTLATIAAAFVGVALLWWLALAPALALAELLRCKVSELVVVVAETVAGGPRSPAPRGPTKRPARALRI
jgi:general secretion pathway protein M